MRKTRNGSGGTAEILHDDSTEHPELTNALFGGPHPLASVAGIFADDPTWDEFVSAMEEARREEDSVEAARLTTTAG